MSREIQNRASDEAPARDHTHLGNAVGVITTLETEKTPLQVTVAGAPEEDAPINTTAGI